MSVIEKYGDRGMAFVWRNKVPLASTAALAAFLADPQPFIDGTRDLAATLGEHVIAPAVGATVDAIAPHVEWTWLAIAVVGILAAVSLAKYYLRQRLLSR